MLPGLLGALALAPLYWLAVPVAGRRDVLAVASLLVLGWLDWRLPALLVGLAVVVWALGRRAPTRPVVVAPALAALAVLFVWNKQGGGLGPVLASQGGLALLGVSYLTLKVAAALLDAARGAPPPADLRTIVAWLVFLPTYPAGPIEPLEHFTPQTPSADAGRIGRGLERILIGLVKALLVAHWLGEWSSPVLAFPAFHDRTTLLLATWATTLRFYLDFAGYSDVAIGLAAVYGVDVMENFDWPLVRRNLVQLWQHWHMTLTRWLRVYLFIPTARALVRRGADDRLAGATGQIVAMTFCGLWHGFTWGFAIWGLLQALGLIWVGIVARDAGRLLPAALVAWWRTHPVARVLSVLLTFQFFSLSLVFAVTSDVGRALRCLRVLLVG